MHAPRTTRNHSVSSEVALSHLSRPAMWFREELAKSAAVTQGPLIDPV